MVAVFVAMVMGGNSGSGPATAAAVGGVLIVALSREAPRGFSVSVVGASAATDILIPPSIAFTVYVYVYVYVYVFGVNVSGASVPALFAAGMVPGSLAGVALIVPAVWLSRRHGFGELERNLSKSPFCSSLGAASWGLAAPRLRVGGMRLGWFTPTEAAGAAVVAVACGPFIGMVVHRSIARRDPYGIVPEASEISAVFLLVLLLADMWWASLRMP